LVVVLDTYSAQRPEDVKAKAAELGIRLEFIPPSYTDVLQPLDRCIFSVLKSDSRQQWTAHDTETGRGEGEGVETTRKEMAESLGSDHTGGDRDRLEHRRG
jgi:hypothetical protein